MQGHCSDWILYRDAKYLCILSMEFALCHASGTQNFEEAPRFLETLCSPGVYCIDSWPATYLGLWLSKCVLFCQSQYIVLSAGGGPLCNLLSSYAHSHKQESISQCYCLSHCMPHTLHILRGSFLLLLLHSVRCWPKFGGTRIRILTTTA